MSEQQRLIPSTDVVRVRLAVATREVRLLRALLKLAADAEDDPLYPRTPSDRPVTRPLSREAATT
jgi:hypothetical protein